MSQSTLLKHDQIQGSRRSKDKAKGKGKRRRKEKKEVSIVCPSEWAWCWWEKAAGWNSPMFGLEWHSEMQALCSTSSQSLFSCPLRTCSLLVHPSGKKAALTNNVLNEAKPWKKWLKRRDNPWSYSKCTFSKSRSAAWDGQCLTSYRASGSDIKFHFPNTLDKLMIKVKTVFIHMK